MPVQLFKNSWGKKSSFHFLNFFCMFIIRVSNKAVQYPDKYYQNITQNNAVIQEFYVCLFLPGFYTSGPTLVSSFLLDKGSCSSRYPLYLLLPFSGSLGDNLEVHSSINIAILKMLKLGSSSLKILFRFQLLHMQFYVW